MFAMPSTTARASSSLPVLAMRVAAAPTTRASLTAAVAAIPPVASLPAIPKTQPQSGR